MDDEALGCGGAIARHVSSGDKVHVCFAAGRVYNHRFDERKNDIEKSHVLKAKAVLGYAEHVFLGLKDERLDASVQDIIIPLEKYFLKIRPRIVYSPFY
ncbi:MAG: PIG-L family deacetylase, partial [Parabacteroides sp.]|nr:PIG-L family deacetylase [Parabacteroides sp.]